MRISAAEFTVISPIQYTNWCSDVPDRRKEQKTTYEKGRYEDVAV
jgi:hypothetical protein